ncbi:MAG: SRPBCC family protein [Jatrophihabitans sp.]|uniref:SRPBCC family protein n=1 Tax=Jatrophihabitans sp. TaxID=1932789 RepID=UPI003F8104B5
MTADPAEPDDAVVATVVIDAPPHVVFPYFTDPSLVVTWLADAARLDATPGGGFAVDMGDVGVRGSYLAVEPPHRVVFTWGVEGQTGLPPGSSTVEVVLSPEGDGTLVTLTHTGLTGEFRRTHRAGWREKLAGLRPR